MTNKSGITPAGWRILVKPQEVMEKTASGIIVTTVVTKDREQMANTTGIVIAMGDQCFEDTSKPWCAVGDKVIFAKYAGLLYLGGDGSTYRVINDKDIVGVLSDDVDLVDPYLAIGSR